MHLPDEVVSRHRTSDGLLTYSRCRCGSLDVWLDPDGGHDRLMATSGHTDAPTTGGVGSRLDRIRT